MPQRKKVQIGGKLESEIGGTSAQNWEKVAPDFDSRFGGIEATGRSDYERMQIALKLLAAGAPGITSLVY